MPEPLLNKQIIDCLQSDFDIQVNSLTILPWGADINSSVYKADAAQSSYFVKLKHGHHHEMGIAIMELLHKAKIQEIIFPIETKDHHLFAHLDDFTILVHPFVEGKNGFDQHLTNEQWIALGKALKQVHQLEVPASLQQQLRKETYSPKWREITRSIGEQLNEISATDKISENLLDFMKAKKTVILKLVDQAEALALTLMNQPVDSVLCHSDIHAGNVLMDANDEIYLVDWDDPILAPKERDLMFIGGAVGNVWNNPDEERFFYQGYGEVSINRSLLAYYRAERIVEDIAQYAQQLLLSSEGGEDRAMRFKHFIAMFEPAGVVDQAFVLS